MRGDEKLKPEYDIMCKVKSWVIDQEKPVPFYHDWNDKEIKVLNKHLLLTSKPMVFLVNLSEKDYIRKKNKWWVFFLSRYIPSHISIHIQAYTYVLTAMFDFNTFLLIIKNFKMEGQALPVVNILRWVSKWFTLRELKRGKKEYIRQYQIIYI